jgi:hypothetical protein
MDGPNIKGAPAISPEMAGQIISWLDQNAQGPAPVAPGERVRVYTLKNLAVVFIGDDDCAIFGESNG